jgi:hypothetical protein
VVKSSWITTCLIILALTLVTASCATSPSAMSSDSAGSGIKGRIVAKGTGEPVAGAHVYAYVDPGKNLIGVADHLSKGSSEDGSYTIELPAGEYYIVSRKRESGANYGPIVTGDLYDHRYEHETIRVQAGKYTQLDFSLVDLSEPMFFQVFTEPQRKTTTGFSGNIVNEKGVPVQGAFATAYSDNNMKRLPDFASTLSDDDGAYVLYLPQGGKWFVGGRSHARGVPKPGEPIGRYDGTPDHSLQVEDGAFIKNVDLVLKPFASEVPEGYKPY